MENKVEENKDIKVFEKTIENNDDFLKLRGAIYGLAIGDALGVPYEFNKRDSFKCTGMKGFGSYLQPKGTFSDDTSMTLALLDSMYNSEGSPDIRKLANNFIQWMFAGKFSINRFTFDIGLTTRKSITKMTVCSNPTECGGTKEDTKGNGSLMRILPLAFYLKNIDDFEKRKQWCFDISSLTHRTLECKIACHFYIEYAIKLLNGDNKMDAYQETVDEFLFRYSKKDLICFDRIFSKKIFEFPRDEIKSSGYVIDTLEASLWCFLTTDNYADAVLKCVNLGRDTDTVASICGGLAGLYYGFDSIPEDWKNFLRGKNIIEEILKNYETITLCETEIKNFSFI